MKEYLRRLEQMRETKRRKTMLEEAKRQADEIIKNFKMRKEAIDEIKDLEKEEDSEVEETTIEIDDSKLEMLDVAHGMIKDIIKQNKKDLCYETT